MTEAQRFEEFKRRVRASNAAWKASLQRGPRLPGVRVSRRRDLATSPGVEAYLKSQYDTPGRYLGD